MVATTIEHIWHFAGHLRLTPDYVAFRVQTGEISYSRIENEFHLSADERLARAEIPADLPDPMAVRHVSVAPFSQSGTWADLRDYHPASVSAALTSPQHAPATSAGSEEAAASSTKVDFTIHHIAPVLPDLDKPAQPEQMNYPAAPTYEIAYGAGGSDTIANLSQTNIASDRDRYSDGPAELNALPPVSGDAAMAEMIALVAEYNPTTLLTDGESVSYWTEAVLDRQEALAAGEVEANPGEAGRFVNGELQLEEEVDGLVDELEPPAREEGSTETGQVAEAGDNLLVNEAIIADLNEAPSTLVVGGRFFETNAIVQTNVLQNQDVLFHSGENAPMLDSSGNTLDSVANFVVEEIARQQGHTSYAGNLVVDIDFVDGDVLDVKTLEQRNVFEDGDVSVQTRSDSYTEVHMGDNAQVNVARFADWGKHYDVVIVLGDYHSANIISQTNVVLDSDVIGVSEGSRGSPSVYSGQNALENEGTIGKYGATTYGGIDGDLDRLMNDLYARNEVEQEAWSSFHGTASGRLDVLFVTGNYYDINVISQINIMADADLIIQTGSGGVQWLSAGGNTAINQASIVNAGGVYDQYLGGELYEDSILVQADLVSDESRTIATDPTALVSELVAFMDHSQEISCTDSVAWNRDVFGHSDNFGNVLT